MTDLRTAPAAHDGPRLTHQGLVYGSDREFLDATVPFCLDGLHRDDAVLAVTTGGNIDLLRQALGDAAPHVAFVTADDWYQFPGRTLSAYYRYVDRHTAGRPRRQVRVIGEPVWHGRDELETREWTRYESAINIAFASCPAWIVCPYDTRRLPEAVVADARRTHPQLVAGPGARASGHYLPPTSPDGAWSGGAREEVPAAEPVPGRAVASMRFGADLGEARSFVSATAVSLGMSPSGAQRLVLAVNEVATNVVQHGGGSGEVVLERTGHRIVCDVTGPGRTGADWYEGYLPPDPAHGRGHGLWVVRQLCELVEIDARHGGTSVRLHVNVS
ncbi:anti-sigma factor RsbA family regulatory protein [Streptomyces sp. NPDC058655]|uniref:anti-sigma factor RsbA family regulatory protein n=1 Tax=Streptomyces sp. NPDC058655 TaxID=3346577 RepID=UPI00365247E5